MKFNRDCKEFSGMFSCDTMKFENYKDCEECKFYQKQGYKILIIKLGAMGDVLRTTPILQALKEKYKNCSITWVVNKESKDILSNNPNISRIWVYDQEIVLKLMFEKFYVVYNFEIDTPATLIANLVKAKKKYGYYFDSDGKTSFYNKAAKYYWERANSDYVNRNNTKTYQEMMFEIAGLEWKKQGYYLKLSEEERKYADRFRKKLKNKPIMGINVGSSKRWAAKQWSKNKIIEFVNKIKKDYNIILLGGKQEQKLKKELSKKLKVLENDSNNTLREFMCVINMCDILITGDTLAMHIGLALNKNVISLFFCTPHIEIEDYGRLRKVISPLLTKYFYTDEYSEELSNSISTEDVLKVVNEVNNK